MKRLIYILLFFLLISCNRSNNKTGDKGLTADSILTTHDTTPGTVIQPALQKLSVMVLPPFDEIANEGISPDIQKYLETEISKDTGLTLIKFPYKDLMDVPYHNVFDKKYCKPITDRIHVDVIIMTKLEQKERTGQMTSDKWSLSIRIYNPQMDTQINSGIAGNNLSDAEIAELLQIRRQDLVEEIKNNR